MSSFEKKISQESAKTAFQLAWSIVKDFTKKAIDEIQVEKAIEKYTENYIRRHGQIKILGMPEPVLLSEIYTVVKIIYPSYLYRYTDIEKLEDSFRNNIRNFETSTERLSGISIANNKKYLNVLGPPGSGKSTFLKKIGMETLLYGKQLYSESDERFNHQCIPVLIELRRFRDKQFDLKTLIQSEFEISGFPESDFFVDNALMKGHLLIILDGLDEVPLNSLEYVIQHIKDFKDKFSNNRYITSCRTAFYKSYFNEFTDVEIANFDNIQIESFIRNWFRLENDKLVGTADNFIQLLFTHSNKATLELARTPLLLTFLCLTFDDSQRFPANRTSLYRRALLILLEKWAAEKRIHNDNIYHDFTSDMEIEMLSEIAAKFYERDKIFFYQIEIKEFIKQFIENTLDNKIYDISKILDAIEIQQGLLVQRAPEIYSFSHLTIQEYLTAHFFYSPKRAFEVVERHLFDKRWREVFLLLTGMPNSDDILRLMTDRLKKSIGDEGVLRSAIDWVNQIVPKSDDFEIDACKRVFFIDLLLRYKRYDDRGFYNSIKLEVYTEGLLASLNKSFANSFALGSTLNKKAASSILDLINQWQISIDDFGEFKNEINMVDPPVPLDQMLIGSRHKYRREILSVIYKALKVPDKLGDYKKKRYQALLNYLEASTLVLDCKNASLRVSKKTWEYVCNGILKI